MIKKMPNIERCINYENGCRATILDIEFDDIDVDGSRVTQEATCMLCNAKWDSVYIYDHAYIYDMGDIVSCA